MIDDETAAKLGSAMHYGQRVVVFAYGPDALTAIFDQCRNFLVASGVDARFRRSHSSMSITGPHGEILFCNLRNSDSGRGLQGDLVYVSDPDRLTEQQRYVIDIVAMRGKLITDPIPESHDQT